MSKITYSVTDSGDLYRLFVDVLGLNARLAGSVIAETSKWLKNNGPEWTIFRLKAIKITYLQHHVGNVTFRDNALSYHKDGTPKGPFRGFWTLRKSKRMLDKVLSSLMIYSGILITGAPTRAQLRIFHQAVVNPRPATKLPPWKISREVRWVYQAAWKNAKLDSLDKWISASSKKVVHWDKQVGLKMVPEISLSMYDHLDDLGILFHGGLRAEGHHVPFLSVAVKLPHGTASYREAQEKSSIKALKHLPCNNEAYSPSVKPIVGSIGYIQERGGKLRAVANPLRAVQCAVSKIANWLSHVARTSLPWDCTFDQDRGVRWAKRKLSQGVKLHSFDLSNASDTIPLEDQISFLRSVGPVGDHDFERHVRFYEFVSRGLWFDKNYPGHFLSWTKGQPLGIVCSFGTFSQAHGARLLQLSQQLGLEDAFVVLGDDVIVIDELASAYYHFVVDTWGCDINLSKTLTSDSLSEFASRLITASREIKTFKFPNGSSRLFIYAKPLELLRKYGKKAIKLIPSQRRMEIQVLSSLPKPRGLGWKWPDKELLSIDGVHLLEYLTSEKLNTIPDVAYMKFVNRSFVQTSQLPHRRTLTTVKERLENDLQKTLRALPSVEVTERHHREREQDLRVAFVADIHQDGGQLTASDLVAWDHSLSGNRGDVNHPRALRIEDKNGYPVSLDTLAFQILHVNTNLEDPSDTLKEEHEHLKLLVDSYPSHRGISTFEERDKSVNEPTRRVRKAFKGLFDAAKQRVLWVILSYKRLWRD